MLFLLSKRIQQLHLGPAGVRQEKNALYPCWPSSEISKVCVFKQLKEYSLRKPAEERVHLSVYDWYFFIKQTPVSKLAADCGLLEALDT